MIIHRTAMNGKFFRNLRFNKWSNHKKLSVQGSMCVSQLRENSILVRLVQIA